MRKKKADKFNELYRIMTDLQMSSHTFEMFIGKDIKEWFDIPLWMSGKSSHRKQIKRIIGEMDGFISSARATRTKLRRLLKR